jgi:hypothetical protein
MQTSPTGAPIATHPLAARWHWFSWFLQGLGVVLAGVLLAPPIMTPTLRDSLLVLMLLPLSAVLMLALTTRLGMETRRSALVLTAAGLDLQGVGYRVRAAWPAVRFLDSGPPMLLIEKGTFEPQGWMRILWPLGIVAGSAAAARARAHVVHLKYYDDAWPDGRLAADLRRLAPGLLPPPP